MKVVIIVFTCVLFMGGLVGCGKTISELRTDGETIVDNGGSLLKKLIGAGVAVYDIVKKVVEDSKDNVNVIKDTVVGPVTPAK